MDPLVPGPPLLLIPRRSLYKDNFTGLIPGWKDQVCLYRQVVATVLPRPSITSRSSGENHLITGNVRGAAPGSSRPLWVKFNQPARRLLAVPHLVSRFNSYLSKQIKLRLKLEVITGQTTLRCRPVWSSTKPGLV